MQVSPSMKLKIFYSVYLYNRWKQGIDTRRVTIYNVTNWDNQRIEVQYEEI